MDKIDILPPGSPGYRIAQELGADLGLLSPESLARLDQQDVYSYASRCVAMERQWGLCLRCAERGTVPAQWPESATAAQIMFWLCLPTSPDEGAVRAWRGMTHEQRHAALKEGVMAVYLQHASSKI